MDNNSIEKKLQNASKEAEKFFSTFDYNKLNDTVLLKLEHKQVKNNKPMFNGLIAKVSVLAACFVIFLMISSMGIKIGNSHKEFASLGKPVSQQMINFGDSNFNQWLNYFKINKPDKKMESNLLAVIWKSGTGGDYEMVYSSVFENSNKPCPVYTIDFPGNESPMVLISSQNDNSEYMHYKVLGYKDNQVLAYMEQDYVTGGKIEIVDGVLKETRLIPNSYIEDSNDQEQMDRIITYFIPYKHNKYGNIIPSIEHLRIYKGEQIALFGDYNVPIDISGQNLSAKKDINILDQEGNIKYIYAKESGYNNIYIKSLNGNISKKVSVEVLSRDDKLKEY